MMDRGKGRDHDALKMLPMPNSSLKGQTMKNGDRVR